MANKKYVTVYVCVDESGKKSPEGLVYNDKFYEIDKILDTRNCASFKVGGIGQRYTIRIGDSVTYLFCEGDKWFVEEK